MILETGFLESTRSLNNLEHLCLRNIVGYTISLNTILGNLQPASPTLPMLIVVHPLFDSWKSSLQLVVDTVIETHYLVYQSSALVPTDVTALKHWSGNNSYTFLDLCLEPVSQVTLFSFENNSEYSKSAGPYTRQPESINYVWEDTVQFLR